MERERQKEKNNLNHLLVHFRELVYQRNRLFLKKKREEKWKYTQYRIFIIKAKSKITAIQYFFFEREIENRVGIISVSYHQKKFFIVSSTAIYIFCSEGTLRNFFSFSPGGEYSDTSTSSSSSSKVAQQNLIFSDMFQITWNEIQFPWVLKEVFFFLPSYFHFFYFRFLNRFMIF